MTSAPAWPAQGTPAPTPPEPARSERCSFSAERRGDQRYGTAAPVGRWLLVEMPGPWGRDAVLESRLREDAAQDLLVRAGRARVRVVLIRRPGRRGPNPLRRWAYVDSVPGQEGVWWGTWITEGDLLALDLARPPDRPPDPGPVYLVCAHGRHDACCAIRGRQVAAALAAVRPEQTWECSHVGGDRFAANVVLLPHGLYYGHVPDAAVLDVVAGYEAGRVEPTWLRGRSSLPAPVQAAQHHARVALSEHRLEALAPLAVEARDERTWTVRLATDTGAVEVTVRAALAPAARLTCGSRRPERARTWELLDLAERA